MCNLNKKFFKTVETFPHYYIVVKRGLGKTVRERNTIFRNGVPTSLHENRQDIQVEINKFNTNKRMKEDKQKWKEHGEGMSDEILRKQDLKYKEE